MFPRSFLCREKPSVSWANIIGSTSVKQRLTEYILLRIKYATLFATFNASRTSFLFGPPQSRKSLLIKALTEEAQASLFLVKAEEFHPNNCGEAEIQAIYEQAKEWAPSIVVFDNIEQIFGDAVDRDNKNVRTVKTEFLIQMSKNPGEVYTIGISSQPWRIDLAVRRRLCYRFLAQLPDMADREELLTNRLSKLRYELSEEEIRSLAERTEGFTIPEIQKIIEESLKELMAKDQELEKETKKKSELPIELRTKLFESFQKHISGTTRSVSNDDIAAFVKYFEDFGTP